MAHPSTVTEVLAHLGTMAALQPGWKVVRLRPEASTSSSSAAFRTMGMLMTGTCSNQHV